MIILGVTSSSDKNAPTAPTMGTAVNVGTSRAYNNGAATVPFTPTYSGGLPVTYTITSSPGSFTASGASSPLTVTGLQSATAYTFTGTATNSLGTSAPSAASNSITATTVPQAPTIGTATDGGTGTSVSVAFTPGATGGSAVTTYTATSSPGGLTGTAASSPITVTGLTTGTAYTFTVTATNANGTSTASSASNSVTPAVPNDFEYIDGFSIDSWGGTQISITSLPQTYKALLIFGVAQISQNTAIYLRVNNDTGSNYQFNYISQYLNNASQVQFTSNGSDGIGTTNSSQNNLSWKYLIHNYASTSTIPSCVNEAGSMETTPLGYLSNGNGLRSTADAVSSVQMRIVVGTMNNVRVSVYGYK